MSKAIALTKTALEAAHARRVDLARSVIVLGSAAALILAGQPFPL